MKRVTRYLAGLCALMVLTPLAALFSSGQRQEPTATRWLLESATPTQRASINSVFMLACPKSGKKGTAFLLRSGTIVSNEHVVRGCRAEDLWARSPTNTTVRFSSLITDGDRDLALLRPTERLQGGLELSTHSDPGLEARVTTWGFPLSHEGPAPLLSVGYVAGYDSRAAESRTIKRIVVNGAFNPGNSGGPLLEHVSNKVIGVVVTKWTLFSPLAESVTQGFKTGRGVSTFGRFSILQADGTARTVSDQEATAATLQEFYDQVQVMIGEAISVEELRAFLREKEGELR